MLHHCGDQLKINKYIFCHTTASLCRLAEICEQEKLRSHPEGVYYHGRAGRRQKT